MATEMLAPLVNADQLDLVKKTVANGATDAELKLFLYDCQRRGIHPLDKLLHFTKRGGRYTPVTSIDFMRAQAAASGEMAGSDDAVFEVDDSGLIAATVVVYRLTQGQRFGYAASARWSEYCPDNAPMWKRMPHTMLGKCAEALALRKAFPQQLAGLYSREEMDQAGPEKNGYSVEAPSVGMLQANSAPIVEAAKSGGDVPREKGETPAPTPNDGALRIVRVDVRPTSNKSVTKHIIVLSDGREVSTIKQQIAALAEQLCQDADPVEVETKTTKWGEDLVGLRRQMKSIDIHADMQDVPPLTDADISF